MMKINRFKKVISIMLLISIIFSNFSYAQDEYIRKRNESIYVNTDAYGNVTKINGYISYFISNLNELKEYGKYDNFQVLTKKASPLIAEDEITWNVSGDSEFGYIGKLGLDSKNNIPWNISIKYYLNGVETLANELPGKSGLVKIVIKVCPNLDANEYYKNNYMMEITSSYDMTKYLSVESKEATVSQVGKTKSLMFIILPGQEKEVSIEIGSEDFSMDGISFGMVPLGGDVLKKVKDVVDDKNKLKDAIDSNNESLDAILNELSKSSKSIDSVINGAQEVQNSLSLLNDGTEERIQKIDSLKEELELLSGDLENVNTSINSVTEQFDYLKERIVSTNKTLKDINNNIKELSNSLKENEKDLDRLTKRAKELPEDAEVLRQLLIKTRRAIGEMNYVLGDYKDIVKLDTSSISKNLYNIKDDTEDIAEEAGMLLQTGGEDPEFYMEVIDTAKSIGSSLSKVSSELGKASSSLEDLDDNMSGLRKALSGLQDGIVDTEELVEKLEDYSKDIPDTLKRLKNTIKSLRDLLNIIEQDININVDNDSTELLKSVDNLDELFKSIQNIEPTLKLIHENVDATLELTKKDIMIISNELYVATNKTIDGSQELLKNLKNISNQSSSLKKSKNTIYNVVKEDVEEIENKTNLFNIDPDAKVVSFVSEKNEDVEKVQIFVQTEAIKKVSEAKEIVDLEPEKENVSFLEKIKMVFAIIIDFITSIFVKR